MIAVVVGAGAFAVVGGEYSTADLLRQRSQTAALEQDVDTLQGIVDSLVAYKNAVETDPIMQERIAREAYGMVRGNKELLYRFMNSPADSAIRP